MMRLFFFLLLLANVVVLLVLQVAHDRSIEPERLELQVNAERVSVIGADGKLAAAPSTPIPASPSATDTTTATAPAEASALSGTATCIEIGDFTTQTAASFEQELSRLSHTGIPQRRVVQPAPSQLVYLPPQRSEADANHRLAQLRKMGFADSAVIRDDPARRWGISLGRFTRTELADAHLEKLREAGVNDALIIEYPPNSTRYAYRLSGVNAAGGARLATAAAHYAGVTMRHCP
jgi:hypothetical protein